MKKQTIEFIDYVKNFKIVREPGDDEFTTLKKYHKSKINACYSYLKVLSSNKNGDNLKEDYSAVLDLSKQFENEYIKWKNAYEKTN